MNNRPINTKNNNVRKLDYTDFIRVNNEVVRKDLVSFGMNSNNKVTKESN